MRPCVLTYLARRAPRAIFDLSTSLRPKYSLQYLKNGKEYSKKNHSSKLFLFYLLSNFLRCLSKIIRFLIPSSTSMIVIIIKHKVEKILKGTLDSIPSSLSLVKSQIMGGKVWLRCKGKALQGIVNRLLKRKSLLTSPSNVLPY